MGTEVVPLLQVVPQGIESVNESSVDMGCTSPLGSSSGVMICGCGSQSYLVDGISPDINTSTSDWASQLVTVRRSEGNQYVNFPHVLLTFGFDTAVSLTGIEMDWFLCPDWGIGAPSITVYLNEDYNLANTNIIPTLPFVSADDNSLQSSCDSLSNVTVSGGSFEGSYYRTIHILVDLSAHPTIEWVHVGEVRFIGIDNPTCLQPAPPSSPVGTQPLSFSFTQPAVPSSLYTLTTANPSGKATTTLSSQLHISSEYELMHCHGYILFAAEV